MVKLASPTFYALRESRTPVLVSVMSIGLNVVLNITLVRVLGYRGLALGTALSALVNAVVLLFLLRRRLGGLDEKRIAAALLKVLAASAVMAAAVVAVAHALQSAWPALTFAARLAQLGATCTGVARDDVSRFAVCEAVLPPALLADERFRRALETAYEKLAAPHSALTYELSA